MKTYKGEFKSYLINELSEKAKEYAYNKWYFNEDYYPWGCDAENTLNEFCRLFDISCRNWSYDSYTYNYRFEITNDMLQSSFGAREGLSGIRLATYIWSNYAKYITKGKYYGKSTIIDGRHIFKSRYSKVLISMFDCPLTGYYIDCEILEPIIDCLTYKSIFDSYEELIERCLDNFFAACKVEVEYFYSMERFIEDAQSNEWEYDVDGNAFYLPREFREIA